MTLAASPGTLIRTEVSVPPYMAPYMMPESIMRAVVAGTPKVIGRSRAMPAAGPMPGRIPIICPSRHPMKVARRFAGVSAIAKPCPSRPSVSIQRLQAPARSEAERPDRQGHPEPPHKDGVDHPASDRGGQEARHELPAQDPQHHPHHVHDGGGDKPQMRRQRDTEYEAECREEHPHPAGLVGPLRPGA